MPAHASSPSAAAPLAAADVPQVRRSRARRGGPPAAARSPRARGAPRTGRSGRSSRSRCRAGSRGAGRARRGGTRRRDRPRSSGRRRSARPLSRRRSSSAPFACVAWTTVVRSPRHPAAASSSIGPHAVLGEALLDLARLLVGVDVQDEPSRRPRSARSPRASRAGRRGRSGGRRRRRIPASRSASTSARYADTEGWRIRSSPPRAVRDVEAREADPRLLGRLRRGEGGVEPEVVELADGRVAGGPHLAVRADVEVAHRGRRVPLRLLEHPVAPGPEVAAGGSSAERALERVAVRVDEAGKRDRSRHGRRH